MQLPQFDPYWVLIGLPPLLFAITTHEFAHAWMAVRCGDPTPARDGRLTFNPLAHLDVLGALLLFFYRFGWGKPVVVYPYNFRNRRRDDILVSVAGVAVNFATALSVAVVLRLTVLADIWTTRPGQALWDMLHTLCSFGVGLTLFNLLPIPPLDGSHVLEMVLPYPAAQALERARPKLVIVFVILFFAPMFGLPNVFGYIIGTPMDRILDLLLGPANGTRLVGAVGYGL
ncbi:MAG: site-2 protease family protein [Planctomycetes bacterium]|nr:site-2 protease family protein [Planctomycetota bacterium]